MDEDTKQNFEKLIKSATEAKLAGRTEEAEMATMQAMMLAATEAENNPTPDMLLLEEAANCEDAADWTGAESARRKLLAMQEADGHAGLVTKAHLDLCRLFKLLGRLEEARDSARQATVAARQADMIALIGMAMEAEARCALLQKDVASALAAIQEAVQMVGEDPLADVLRGSLHVARAECRIAKDDLPGAEGDLAASWKLLGETPHAAWAGGANSRLADWWELDTLVRAKNGDLAGALDSSRQAVTMRRQVAELPHVQGPYTKAAVAQSLEKCADILQKAGDSTAAEEHVNEACQIRKELKLPERL